MGYIPDIFSRSVNSEIYDEKGNLIGMVHADVLKINPAKLVAVMLEKYKICCEMMQGFDWSKWSSEKPAERMGLILAAQEYILAQEDGKRRWKKAVLSLSRAFSPCAESEEAIRIRDDWAFFKSVRSSLNKSAGK